MLVEGKCEGWNLEGMGRIPNAGKEAGPSPTAEGRRKGAGPFYETPPSNRYIGCPTQAYAVFSN